MSALREAAAMVLECIDQDYGQLAKDCAVADLRRALETPDEGLEGDWECCRDHSFYDLWAVRPKNARGSDEPFRVMGKDEARRLCKTLNQYQAAAKDRT